MQVVPNLIPLVRINAPEIFADEQFREWLNEVTANGRKGYPGDRIASWHWPGHEPDEYSDIFMVVDGPDGSDSDMPEHCWEMIVEAVARAIPNSYPECIVWLTSVEPIDIGCDGFEFDASCIPSEPCASESSSSEHPALNRRDSHRSGEPPAQFDADSSDSSAQPLRVPLAHQRPHALIRSIMERADEKGVRREVAEHLIGATLMWQVNRCTLPDRASESESIVRRVSRIRGFEVQDCVFAIALDPPEFPRIEELRELLKPSNAEVWILASAEQLEDWRSVAAHRLCSERVVVTTIETFIGQSISWHGGFSSKGTAAALSAIIKTYNRHMIDTAETPELRIVINEVG